MLISWRWLGEWVPGLPGPAELAKIFVDRGFGVDAVLPRARFSGVVVGRVVERDKHPNADRLSLCQVDVGAGGLLEIVCGAPNARAGITVAVAVDGARLPGGVLKKSKIRGVVSNGMLCSARELELSEEHEGILELDPGLPVGADFAAAAGLDDTLLDIDVPFNRGDALCARGLAREAAAALHVALANPIASSADGPLPAGDAALPGASAVDIESAEDCPRYAARVVRGLQVGASPAWLKARLEAHGMRSVNNVVDATNLTLLELGQPIHAFDLSKVRGGRLVVRRARAGESLRTLDGAERTLSPEVLVIADPVGVLALAGLMGGEGSEVRPETRAVLLESACFSGPRVRMGGRALGLKSEAARRFERGTDVEAVVEALDRVASLLQALAGGEIAPGILDAYPGRRERGRLTLRSARVRKLLGYDVPATESLQILAGLGFEATPAGASLDVRVPSWRVDVDQEIDLIEEIARSRGYQEIGEDPGSITPIASRISAAERFDDRLRALSCAMGYSEAITSIFVGAAEADSAPALPPDARRHPLALANPLSREASLLRPSLLPGLLRSLAHNVRHGRDSVRLFELGRAFLPGPGPLADEREELGWVATGARHAGGFGLGADRLDFHDVKGQVEALLEALRIDNVQYVAYDGRGFRAGHAAEARLGSEALGFLGQVEPRNLAKIEVSGTVFAASFSVAALIRASRPPGAFAEWPRFPSVKRDLAFLVDRSVESGALEAEIRAVAGPTLRSLQLFDLYQGDRVPAGQKNLAFSLEFQSLTQTLSDTEVDAALKRVAGALEQKHGARLRS